MLGGLDSTAWSTSMSDSAAQANHLRYAKPSKRGAWFGLVWFPPRHRITCILVSSTLQCLEESPAKPKAGSPLSLWLYNISQLLDSFSVTKIQWSMITFSVFKCSSLLEDARKRQTLSKLSFSRSRYKPTWNKWDIHILCLWRRKCNTLTTGFWIY